MAFHFVELVKLSSPQDSDGVKAQKRIGTTSTGRFQVYERHITHCNKHSEPKGERCVFQVHQNMAKQLLVERKSKMLLPWVISVEPSRSTYSTKRTSLNWWGRFSVRSPLLRTLHQPTWRPMDICCHWLSSVNTWYHIKASCRIRRNWATVLHHMLGDNFASCHPHLRLKSSSSWFFLSLPPVVGTYRNNNIKTPQCLRETSEFKWRTSL